MKVAAPLLVLLAACASPRPYINDPQEQTYEADRDVVFHGMVSALQQEGYEINVADPIRLRVEAKAGDRIAILQGIDKGGKILVRIGMVRAEARDFQRLWSRLEKELDR